MTRATCRTCTNAERIEMQGDDIYECRLDPPDFMGRFPRVMGGVWCAQHGSPVAKATEIVVPRDAVVTGPTPFPGKITRPIEAKVTRGKAKKGG